MSEIQIFNNPQFGEIRILADEANEPLFCAADVCKALGYTNPRKAVADHIDEGDVTKRDTPTTSGVQTITFVNESGLYSLIFGSRLDSAKAFKKWVTSEVLPAIRKTGGYISTKADDTPEMIMARAVLVAQATIEKQSKQIAEQTAKIEADAPKVLFADAVAGSSSSCLIGDLAKVLTQNGYKIGQNRLFEKLRNEGYLGTKGEYYNVPNQRYQEMGLFTIKKRTVNNPDGSIIVKATTKVTGKGQQYFINKFIGESDS
jgi:anti-repressor protein